MGGDNYDEIADHLWIFAILGTVLSMLQLLVYSVLARQGQRSVYLVWAAFVAMIGLGLAAGQPARPADRGDRGRLRCCWPRC